jgi:hypothetical protein
MGQYGTVLEVGIHTSMPAAWLTFAEAKSVDAALVNPPAALLGSMPKVSKMDSMADASSAVMPAEDEVQSTGGSQMDTLQVSVQMATNRVGVHSVC